MAFGVDVPVERRDGDPEWPVGDAERVATGGPLVVWRHPALGFLLDGGAAGRHAVSADGRRVSVWGGDSPMLAAQTLPLAASLQGRACLHASAVVIDGRAVVCCGASGAGKTTIARALVASGAELLSDDVVAVDPDLSAWGLSAGPFPVASAWVLGSPPEAPPVQLLLASAFVGWVRDQAVQVALLDACAALASSVPVRRLRGTAAEAAAAVLAAARSG